MLLVFIMLFGWVLCVVLWVIIVLGVLFNFGVNIIVFVVSLGIGGIVLVLVV